MYREPNNLLATARALQSEGRIGRLVALCLAITIANVLLISWLDPALPWPLSFTTLEPWAVLALNAVPVLLLNVLLFLVTRRLVLASWLSLLLLAGLYAVNTVKLRELATPLLPDDFLFLKALKVNYSFFSRYLAAAEQQLVWACAILAMTLLLARERAVAFLSGRRRLLGGLGVVVLAFTLMQGLSPWRSLYDPGRLQFEPWAPSASALRIGVITNLLLFHWELNSDGRQPPDLADAHETVRVSLERVRNAAPPAAGSAATDYPDIVIVQSESLFEPAWLEAVDEPQLKGMREVATQGASGLLHVPTFAGGTIRTEFEMLTGMPLAAFPRVRYPYLQLDLQRTPSMIKTLAQHGYRTLAIHPNGGEFWNRNHAFRALGFERFEDVKSFRDAAHHGWYVGDEALTDRVMASLEDEGPPQLILAISIQNHGPYLPSGATRDSAPCSNDRKAHDVQSLDVYCALVRTSDAQFMRLVEHARKRTRRTLILFYSDHMPPLQSIYDQVPFRNALTATEQPVPWVLFDSASMKQEVRDLHAWELPMLLLERAQVAADDYFDLMRETLRDSFSEEVAQALAQLRYWDQLGPLLAEVPPFSRN